MAPAESKTANILWDVTCCDTDSDVSRTFMSKEPFIVAEGHVNIIEVRELSEAGVRSGLIYKVRSALRVLKGGLNAGSGS